MSVFEKSKFIWTSDFDGVNTYVELYKDFQIALTGAICNISCDGDYTLFINGKYASSNQYGDYEHYKVYDTIDISHLVHEGKNHFALLCHHFGEDSSRYKKYKAGAIFEIISDGEVVLASNESVLSRASRAYFSGPFKRVSSQLGFSYRYDATREDAWTLGEGEGFEKSHPVCKNCTFFARPIKKLSLGDFVGAKLISSGDGYSVYDLGREYVGLLSFRLRAKDECEINVAYGECLKNGRVKRQIYDRSFNIDYVARGGENAFTHYMLRFACRYLEISTQGEVNVDSIGIIPQFYEVRDRAVSLSGIDAQIYEACLNTLHLCMMEHYVDCPWREQCLYAFDSRNQMLCGYYAFEGGNFEYARASLRLLGESQREDGLLSICSPCGITLAIPSFSLYFLISVKEYIEHSGDASLGEELNGTLLGILEAFLENERDGIICRFEADGYWNFYDWSAYLNGSLGQKQMGGGDIIASSLAILALDAYEKICKLCSLPFELACARDKIRKGAKARFFDTESGLFAFDDEVRAPLELSNALAILAGLCTPSEAKRICEALKNNELSPCSLSMKCFKYDAMLLCDKEKYACAVINEIRASYEKMVEGGTVWETAEGESDFDGAGSLCHGWSATPIYYYHKLLK